MCEERIKRVKIIKILSKLEHASQAIKGTVLGSLKWVDYKSMSTLM